MQLKAPNQFATRGAKVHITISSETLLLRCGGTGTRVIGNKYHGDDAAICKRCFASYFQQETGRFCPLCGQRNAEPRECHKACTEYEGMRAEWKGME